MSTTRHVHGPTHRAATAPPRRSARPYVSGVHTDRQRAAAFHPLPRGIRATAAALEDLLAD